MLLKSSLLDPNMIPKPDFHVTVGPKEGREVFALHCTIIAGRSPFFARQIERLRTTQPQWPDQPLKGTYASIKPEDFRHIVEWMYAGECKALDEHLRDLDSCFSVLGCVVKLELKELKADLIPKALAFIYNPQDPKATKTVGDNGKIRDDRLEGMKDLSKLYKLMPTEDDCAGFWYMGQLLIRGMPVNEFALVFDRGPEDWMDDKMKAKLPEMYNGMAIMNHSTPRRKAAAVAKPVVVTPEEDSEESGDEEVPTTQKATPASEN